MRAALEILGLGAVGLAGALPPGGRGDPALALAWLALWATPAGCLAAARGPGRAWLAPAVWSGGLALLLGGAAPELPWGLAAGAGLFGLGAGLGARDPRAALARAAALLLGGALLAALPSCGGVAGEAPWSPVLAARWLDASPASLVVECAGIDWMRHPAVYAPVGADAIGPQLRLPWRGSLAGPTVLMVGCALAWWGARASARPTARRQE